MLELLEACKNPVNLFLTIALGVCVFYWLTVILGAIDMDTFDLDLDADLDVDIDADFDVDVDADVDIDADIDADTHVGAGGAATGLGMAVLRFFNLGDVPLMVFLTVVMLSMWLIGIGLFEHIHTWSVPMQMAIILPNFVVSLFVSKIATWPVKSIFRKLRAGERQSKNFKMIGKQCIIKTPTADATHGQAEITADGASILLSVRTEKKQVIKKGETAVIVSQNKNKGYYTIKAL